MIELSNERVNQILTEETHKTQELATLLRAIYRRYMNLYEKYFEDIDALDDQKIEEMKKYQAETTALVKYYYMDIPQDICDHIREFDKEFITRMFADDWQKYIYESYDEFRDSLEEDYDDEDEDTVKALFKETILNAFYDEMGEIFRDGFNTHSKHAKKFADGLNELLYGKKDH